MKYPGGKTVWQKNHSEYEMLGRQLKQTTLNKLAEKFETSAYAISGAVNLDDNDIRLIREIRCERRALLNRRAELRLKLCF